MILFKRFKGPFPVTSHQQIHGIASLLLVLTSLLTLCHGLWAQPPLQLTQQQVDTFHHFADLNHQVIQLSKPPHSHCNTEFVNTLSQAVQTVQENPFIQDILNANGDNEASMNLALHLAQCYREGKEFMKAGQLIESASKLVPYEKLSQIHQNFYINELGEIYEETQQWQKLNTLLEPLPDDPQYPHWTIKQQGWVLHHLCSANIGLQQYAAALAYHQRYEKHLTELDPENTEEKERIQDLITTLQGILTTPENSHYVHLDNPKRHRWHDDKNTVHIYFDQTVNPKEWNNDRMTLLKKSFTLWEQALQEIRPTFQFEYTQNPLQYDVRVRLVDEISQKKNPYKEVMGLNQKEVMKFTLLKNNIELALNKKDKTRVTDDDLYRVALHEIGHMMGLGHSKRRDDVMMASGFNDYGVSSASKLSKRDIRTLHTIYSNPIPVTTPPFRTLSEVSKLTEKNIQISQWAKKHKIDQVLQGADEILQTWPHSAEAYYLKLNTLYWHDKDKNMLKMVQTIDNLEDEQGPLIYYSNWPTPAMFSILRAGVWVKLAESTHQKSRRKKKYKQHAINTLKKALKQPDLKIREKKELIDVLNLTLQVNQTETRWAWERRPHATIIRMDK